MKLVPHMAPISNRTESTCPKCYVRYIMYNGNYYCEGRDFRIDGNDIGCDWVMNERHYLELELFVEAYSSLMRNRGLEPNQEIIDDTRRMSKDWNV